MTTEKAVAIHDLFISYAESDRAWVDGFLLDALEQAGVKYHSEDAFALGVPRLIEFERAIKQCARTLLILSPAYLVDTFGQFVDVLVNSYGMETATWPVIPLTLQTCDLPPRLSQLVRLDASTLAIRSATSPSSRSSRRYQGVRPSDSEIWRKPSSPASGEGASANHSSMTGNRVRWIAAVRETPLVSAPMWRSAATGSW